MTSQLELLAPAGDFEKLRYALAFGANAVYAGQPQFSLRARENGFSTPDSIAEAIEYTHKLGRKFFLTSNIIPHNNKIKVFQKSLSEFVEMKPDALIMTDPGMIGYIRKNHPHQEIHLSVQANCTNWSTARFWYDLGVKRIILSRELNLREIREIHQNVPEVELEVFVHGAICMAYSGRCLLSNYMSNRDSNQGMCSNACRLSFSLYAKNTPQDENYTPLEGEFYLKAPEEGEGGGMMLIDEDQYGTYIMNSKDMCAIELLQELKEAGICSFKIEGRTKSLYYLSQVVRNYRGAIDDVEAGRPISAQYIEGIKKVDNRGSIPGFFKPQRELPQNYESTRVKSETAQVVGFVREYVQEKGKARLSVKGQILEGDLLELTTPETTFQFRAQGLVNHRREAVQKLDSGMEYCLLDVPFHPGPYAFIVKILEPQLV